jgi:hypothetical protein
MGIKEKLPLVNSETKGIRIVGYAVYGIVLLMILGALVPSQDATTSHPSNLSHLPPPQRARGLCGHGDKRGPMERKHSLRW